MMDKKFEPVNLIPWIILFGLLMLLADAKASGDDLFQSNDMNNQTAGSVVTGASKAIGLGFSYGMGDVDINECLVSTQKGNIIFGNQGFEYNLWCMGEVYDAKGLFRMGALMRCDIPAVRVHFDDDAACIAANEVVVAEPVEREPRFEEEEREDLEQIQMQQAVIVDRLDGYDAQRRRAVSKAREEQEYNAEFLEKFKEVTSE